LKRSIEETTDDRRQTTDHRPQFNWQLATGSSYQNKPQIVMRIKLSIWIVVIGFMIGLIGVWMKITHQLFADFVLGASALLKLLGVLLLAIFLLRHPKVKEFLHYDEHKDSLK
jgi:glucan phosphoethanolaminetransferase (alkaline phosphatase superfamily)